MDEVEFSLRPQKSPTSQPQIGQIAVENKETAGRTTTTTTITLGTRTPLNLTFPAAGVSATSESSVPPLEDSIAGNWPLFPEGRWGPLKRENGFSASQQPRYARANPVRRKRVAGPVVQGQFSDPATATSSSGVVELSEADFFDLMSKQNNGNSNKAAEEVETSFQAGSGLVFLSQNNTLLTAHAGSHVILPCLVREEGQFGMVSGSNCFS